MTEAAVLSVGEFPDPFARHKKICALMDETGEHLASMHGPLRQDWDWWVFREALGDSSETHSKFSAFLRDVSTCPPEVIAWCQEKLNAQP